MHIIAENTIFHESNLLITVTTSYHACPVTISNRWLARRPTLRTRFYWLVLPRQRSCSLIHGIFINAGVGNPTVPWVQLFEDR